MAEFKRAVLTRQGIELLAKAQAESKTILFTKCVTGDGKYDETEDISLQTHLKSQKQEFIPGSIKRQNDTNVFIQFSITNKQETGNLTHGYYVNELGIIANDPDIGEILYAIAIAEEDKADWMPAYDELLPTVIMIDFLIEVSNADNVTITTDMSAYATRAELENKADGFKYDEQTGILTVTSGDKILEQVPIFTDKADYVRKETVEQIETRLKEVEDLLRRLYAFSYSGNDEAIVTYLDEVQYNEEEENITLPDDLASYDDETITLSGGGGGGGGGAYILPVATAARLGGVKIGTGINSETDGTISVDSETTASTAADMVEKNATAPTDDDIDNLFS